MILQKLSTHTADVLIYNKQGNPVFILVYDSNDDTHIPMSYAEFCEEYSFDLAEFKDIGEPDEEYSNGYKINYLDV